MVAIAIARMIVCAMGIISRPTDDHTHASRRSLESFQENLKKISQCSAKTELLSAGSL
jgi:hypothetical protein